MTDLLVIAIAAFGLAYVVGNAEITYSIRGFAWTFRWWKGHCGKCNSSCMGHTTAEEDAIEIDCPMCKGKVNNIVHSPHYFQFLVRLVECPACFGWWIGLAIGIAVVIWKPTQLLATLSFMEPLWLLPLYTAFAVCGSNFILARIGGLLPAKYPTTLYIEPTSPYKIAAHPPTNPKPPEE